MTQHWNPIFSCWLVLVVMLLSSAQMTLMSLDPMADLMELVSDNTGEEETEESETEEETKNREFDRALISFSVNHQMSLGGNPDSFKCNYSVLKEVFSPPPEV